MDGAPTEPGGALGPANFRNPYTVTAAFLAALRAKDPDRLAQTTALRAPTEASVKYQKVFASILEQSLAPEDIEELASKFDGMTIIGHNQPKSDHRFDVIVGGTKGTSQYHRTITCRLEKAGWKVVDISGAREFEKPITIIRPPTGGRMGSGRR